MIPLSEDCIFNASGRIARKPDSLGAVKGVDRFDQPDGADGNQVVLFGRVGVVLLNNVGDKPEVVLDEFGFSGSITPPHAFQTVSFFCGSQGPWEGTGTRDVQNEKNKPGQSGANCGTEHRGKSPFGIKVSSVYARV